MAADAWVRVLSCLPGSPYVRKTAVIACVKLHRLQPEALVQNDAVNTLYNMLRDRDAQVGQQAVTNTGP